MKLGLLKRGQKGITLVELMVVMGILAVLASIVFPAVSGTQEVSKTSQVKSDAGTVNTAVGDFFADQEGAEIVTTDSSLILGDNTTQVKSSAWPEKYLDVMYPVEFPDDPASTTGDVEAIVITTDNTTISPVDLAGNYNAIDLVKLHDADYIPAIPQSSITLSGSYHNYLWLLEKTQTASDGGTVVSREVAVFKLTKVETAEGTGYNTLYYEQIY